MIISFPLELLSRKIRHDQPRRTLTSAHTMSADGKPMPLHDFGTDAQVEMTALLCAVPHEGDRLPVQQN